MRSLLMTAPNGQKVYDRTKTQTRRVIGGEALSIIGDFAGDEPDESALSFQWVTNFEREDDCGHRYRYTGMLVSLEEYPDEGALDVPCPYVVGEMRYIREPHYLYGSWQRDGKTKTGKPKYRFIADRVCGVLFPDHPPAEICTKKSQVGWFRRPGMFMPQWAARSFVRITAVRAERVQAISIDDARAEGILRTHCPDWHAVADFRALWDSPSIHGAGAWERNDWVWPVTFERVERP